MVKMPSKGSAAATTLYLWLLVLLLASSPSCLVRRRVITRKGGQPVQTLLTADKDLLIKIVADQYAAIQAFNATVDMAPALGTANKGKITEYKDVRAYILFRKPSFIRIIGLYPVVRNKAFDMVSDGSQFSLYLPSKSRFIKGPNQIEKPSANKLENLRPQHFLDALLVRPIDTAREQTILENFTDEDNAVYKLSVIAPTPGSAPVLERELWFERLKLQLVRELIFDPSGDILTDARYSDWKVYDNIPFPKHIEIERPKDEYGVVITVVKMDINKPIADDQFKLEQPEGTQLQIVGAEPEPPKPAATPPPAKKGKKKK
jgi:outer membrane lipoprotein-sorting protein